MKLSAWQVWEQPERVGRSLVDRSEGEVRRMERGEGPKGPANAPDLLVISPPVGRNSAQRSGRSGDGGRLQDRRRKPGERWCEYPTGPLRRSFGPAGKAAVVYRVARDEGARTGLRGDPQERPHWRYTASCERLESGEKTYREPEPERKTFVATTEKIDRFPKYVELEARRRGIMEADTVAVVGDGGDLVWRTAKEACEARRAHGKRVFEILDIIHASGHLVEAAKAGFGASKERADWLNARLAELWSGDAEELVEAVEAKAEELGRRPERRKPGDGGKDRDEADPVKVLWNARDYFHDNRARIRYDVFRRHGLPLSSAHIESGIPVRQDRADRQADRTSGKQANRRVKGSEKAWYLEHAEEMLALRCLALSQDGRWDDYFDGLREGGIDLPTAGRLRARTAESLPQESRQEEAA